MLRALIYLTLTVLCLPSCRPVSDYAARIFNSEDHPEVIKFIEEKIGESTVDFNVDETYAIGLASKKNPMGTVKYIIVQVSTQQVIAQGSFKPGSIKWVSDYEVELFDAPEIIHDEDDTTNYRRIINVSTRP